MMHLEKIAEVDNELSDILAHTSDKVLQDRSSKENMIHCSPSPQLGNSTRLRIKKLRNKLEDYKKLLINETSLSSPIASQSASLNKAFIQSGTLGLESKDLSISQCQKSVAPLNKSQLIQYFGSNYSLMSITQREKILYSLINKNTNYEVIGHDVGIEEVMNISKLLSVKKTSVRGNSQAKSLEDIKEDLDLSQVFSSKIECQQSVLIEGELLGEKKDDTLNISFKDNLCEQQVLETNTLKEINEAICFPNEKILPKENELDTLVKQKNEIELLEISAISPLESPEEHKLKEVLKKSTKHIENDKNKRNTNSTLMKELAKMSKSLGDAPENTSLETYHNQIQDKKAVIIKKNVNQTFNAERVVQGEKQLRLKLLKYKAGRAVSQANDVNKKQSKGHTVFSINKKKRKVDTQQTPKFIARVEKTKIKLTNNSLMDYSNGKCNGKGTLNNKMKKRIVKSIKLLKMSSSKRTKKVQNSSMVAKIGLCQPLINLKRIIK